MQDCVSFLLSFFKIVLCYAHALSPVIPLLINVDSNWINWLNVWRWEVRVSVLRLAVMVLTPVGPMLTMRSGAVLSALCRLCQWVLAATLIGQCCDSLCFKRGQYSAGIAEGGKRHCDGRSNSFCYSWKKLLNHFQVSSVSPPYLWVLQLWIQRADSTMPFCVRDLSILGFWYLQKVLEPILLQIQGDWMRTECCEFEHTAGVEFVLT